MPDDLPSHQEANAYRPESDEFAQRQPGDLNPLPRRPPPFASPYPSPSPPSTYGTRISWDGPPAPGDVGSSPQRIAYHSGQHYPFSPHAHHAYASPRTHVSPRRYISFIPLPDPVPLPWTMSSMYEKEQDIRARERDEWMRRGNPFQLNPSPTAANPRPGFPYELGNPARNITNRGTEESVVLPPLRRHPIAAATLGMNSKDTSSQPPTGTFSHRAATLPIRSTSTPPKRNRSPSPNQTCLPAAKCPRLSESPTSSLTSIHSGDTEFWTEVEELEELEATPTPKERSSSGKEPLNGTRNEPERGQHCEGRTVVPFASRSVTYHLCEFIQPCRMTASPDGMHHRKVVSHVFGRNKASTKLFPDDVWVHYCRKHYQRARYRADQWPFTQCELILESLRRMEDWNGVESFELTLRRREQLRIEEPVNSGRNSRGRQRLAQAARTPLPTGRKHPTAIVSPVPVWLRDQVGRGKSFTQIREIVTRVRAFMIRLREDEKSARDRASGRKNPAGESAGTSSSNRKASSWKLGTRQRRASRSQGSRVRFPDVEILPTFQPWVLHQAVRQREQGQTSPLHQEATVEEEGLEEKQADPGIGRTGVNLGRSTSQRRRNQANFLRTIRRVTASRVSKAVKNPSSSQDKDKEKEK